MRNRTVHYHIDILSRIISQSQGIIIVRKVFAKTNLILYRQKIFMKIYKFHFVTYLILGLSIIIGSCSNDGEEERNEAFWVKEPTQTDYLRLRAQVFEEEDYVTLLPGKGAYRFSQVPELLRFDGSEWTLISEYSGFASSGSSGYWQDNGVGYLVSGVNSSSAPTDELVKLDIENSNHESLSRIPEIAIGIVGSANTNAKGYISYVNTSTNFSNIYSYDFGMDSWDKVSVPYDSSVAISMMQTIGDSLFLIVPSLSVDNFFVYLEGEKQWVSLPDFPGDTRESGGLFKRYKDYLIYGTGILSENKSDLWKFRTDSYEWERMSDYPGTPFSNGFSFILNGRLYLGGGITELPISASAMNGEMWSVLLD